MVLQPFVWEEILDMITRSGIAREIKNRLITAWMLAIQQVIEDQELGIKKVLDMEMDEYEVNGIFDHTGYSVCHRCHRVVDDDHKHLWESSG